LRDADVAKRVGEFADAEEWPTEKRVESILWSGKWQHTFIRPKVFTYSLFPLWWAASFTGGKPEERLWEGVRPLDPLPAHYRGRFTNVQAAMGLAGLKHLPEFIERTRRHARMLDEILGDLDGVTIPKVPQDRTHVYYQYCPYVPESETIVKRCIRRGVDVAPMHVDICSELDLFGWQGAPAPNAGVASKAVQLPMYESLLDSEVERVGRLVRTQVERLSVGARPAAVRSRSV
jgi:hypothetical protein